MDALERMFQEEADTLAFLLQEEFMEDIMDQSIIRLLQDEAYQASNILPGSEATAHVQVIMLAEIALQLARINEKLNTITERGGSADLLCQLLHDLVKAQQYGKQLEDL